jgi:hypothetical protein
MGQGAETAINDFRGLLSYDSAAPLFYLGGQVFEGSPTQTRVNGFHVWQVYGHF